MAHSKILKPVIAVNVSLFFKLTFKMGFGLWQNKYMKEFGKSK